jgi:hypothetical protein
MDDPPLTSQPIDIMSLGMQDNSGKCTCEEQAEWWQREADEGQSNPDEDLEELCRRRSPSSLFDCSVHKQLGRPDYKLIWEDLAFHPLQSLVFLAQVLLFNNHSLPLNNGPVVYMIRGFLVVLANPKRPEAWTLSLELKQMLHHTLGHLPLVQTMCEQASSAALTVQRVLRQLVYSRIQQGYRATQSWSDGQSLQVTDAVMVGAGTSGTMGAQWLGVERTPWSVL